MGTPETRMTKQERNWRSQDDARILADSEVIKGDGPRLIAAKKAALVLAKEDKDRADAMRAVSKTKLLSDKTNKKKRVKKKAPKDTHNVFARL